MASVKKELLEKLDKLTEDQLEDVLDYVNEIVEEDKEGED
jgi:hypothetical protein